MSDEDDLEFATPPVGDETPLEFLEPEPHEPELSADDFLHQYAAVRFDPKIDPFTERGRLAAKISQVMESNALPRTRRELGDELVRMIAADDFAGFAWIAKNLKRGLVPSKEIEVVIDALESEGMIPDNQEFEKRVKLAGGDIDSPKTQQRKRKRLGIHIDQARNGPKKKH